MKKHFRREVKTHPLHLKKSRSQKQYLLKYGSHREVFDLNGLRQFGRMLFCIRPFYALISHSVLHNCQEILLTLYFS